jgi:signal peptidase I
MRRTVTLAATGPERRSRTRGARRRRILSPRVVVARHRYLTAALAVGALAVLGRRLARLEPVLVAGDSMRPTLLPGQRVAVGPLDRPPRRGDLVVVRRSGLELVKRVVGLPGERVRLAAGRLEVDGLAVAEPYLDATPHAGDLDLRLGEDQYLVLGDHRAASTDGRDFGPVPAAALAGRVRFAYWPPRRLPDPARMPRSVQIRPTGGR